jgi:hypothetical protein
MSAAADKRIAAIGEKVREERALLSELNKQIGADLKADEARVVLFGRCGGIFPCAGSAPASAAFGKRMGKMARQC